MKVFISWALVLFGSLLIHHQDLVKPEHIGLGMVIIGVFIALVGLFKFASRMSN